VSSDDVVIVPYRDGPYLVRGPFSLRDQDGRRIDVVRKTVALCRCGKSRTRPFCDGTHRLSGFRAASQAERPWRAPDACEMQAGRTPPEVRPPERRHTSDQAKLLRARAKASSLLEAPSPAETDIALRTAEPLIAGACLLLAQGALGAEPGDDAACRCLIGEALRVLSSVTASSDSGVGELVSLLTAVALSLRGADGRWR
jgi:CDGSH-type Zn-finger protein